MPLAEHDLQGNALALDLQVSIHVPLAEHDLAEEDPRVYQMSFNSRAPRGARPLFMEMGTGKTSFNSRAPRGARL